MGSNDMPIWKSIWRSLIGVLILGSLTACGGAQVELNVNVLGDGTITSPSGLDCGNLCTTTIKLQSSGGQSIPQQVELTASPVPGASLLGWNYPTCEAADICTVSVQDYCAKPVGSGCAIWDHAQYDLTPVFVVDSEVEVKAWSPYSSCVIYIDGQLSCWNNNGEYKYVPPLSNPVQVVSNQAISCAEDDNGVQCWGGFSEPTWICPDEWETLDDCFYGVPEPAHKPDLYPPLSLAAGKAFVCALDLETVKCWDGYGHIKLPAVNNPTNLRTSGLEVCVDDDDDTEVCWDTNYIRN